MIGVADLPSTSGITSITPFNNTINWNHNEEYNFLFDSDDLSQLPDATYRLCSASIPFGIKLEANIVVQVFNDFTLRVKMHHIKFYTSDGPLTMETARAILDSKTTSASTGISGLDDFAYSLELPMMITVKRGRFRKITVSKSEPEIVTQIKMSLVEELQNVNSSLHLKNPKTRFPMTSILQLPSELKQLEVLFMNK